MTDTIAFQGVLLLVPTDSVLPNPANPRRDATPDAELIASIREHGLIHPLVARRAESEPGATTQFAVYELLAGHRRHAACVELGVAEVPVIVREDCGDDEALQILLIENLARRQLCPSEEAAGYQALSGLGLSQRDIADKVGVTQSTVSKRLSLLKLPETARAAVDSGRITLDDGVALARIPGDTVTKLFARDEPLAEYDVAQAIRDHEIVERRAKAKADAEKAGLPLIDVTPAGWVRHLGQPNADHPVLLSALLRTAELVDLPEGHDRLACHAGYVAWDGALQLVCTDPQSHRIAPSDAPDGDVDEDDDPDGDVDEDDDPAVGDTATSVRTGEPPQSARQTERNQALEAHRDARTRRLDFARTLIHYLGVADGLHHPEGAPDHMRIGALDTELPEIVRLAAWTLTTAAELGAAGMDLVGLDHAGHWDEMTGTWHRYIAKGNVNQARALLAQAAEIGEDHIVLGDWRPDDDEILAVRAWLNWLVDHGYQLDPDEEDLAGRRTNHEATVIVEADDDWWVLTCTNCDDADLTDQYDTHEAAVEAMFAHLADEHGQPDTRQTNLEEAE